jgi:putative chitinase
MTRTITAITDTIAIDDDKLSGNLTIHKGQTYQIDLVLDKGTDWLITLSYGQGDWLFKKDSITFSGNDIITKEQAESVYGVKMSDFLFKNLIECMTRFEINTPPRIRHWLAQTGHESAGLRYFLELASGAAYNGRKDLGNIYPGDGPKYRGTGALQVTGRNWHTQFSNYIGDPLVISKGATYTAQKYSFTISGFWWMKNNMNRMIDKGATIEQTTKRINGGLTGLQDRKLYYSRALSIIK